jgi:hypothetical protein
MVATGCNMVRLPCVMLSLIGKYECLSIRGDELVASIPRNTARAKSFDKQ